jgi:hypothetical protein
MGGEPECRDGIALRGSFGTFGLLASSASSVVSGGMFTTSQCQQPQPVGAPGRAGTPRGDSIGNPCFLRNDSLSQQPR